MKTTIMEQPFFLGAQNLASGMDGTSSASQAFSSVMGEVTATFIGSGGNCDASGGNGFVCGTSALADPRLYTHEFGHTFSQEFGNRPASKLDDVQKFDLKDNWVFGTQDGSYVRTTLGYKSKGAPNMYHGTEWDDWDSNVNNVARNEDYADMFMNWVYDSFDYRDESYGAGYVRYDWMTVNVSETVNGR